MFCDKCGTYLSEGTEFCTNCGAPQGDAAVESELNGGASATAAVGMPMKWHNFLVKFALYLSMVGWGYYAITDLIQLTRMPVGMIFFYTFCMMVIYVALAIHALRTRNALAKFKKGAPKMLNKYFVLTLIPTVLGAFMPVLYGMPMRAVGGTGMSNLIGSVIGTVVAIILHNVYYKKRAELFVN